MSPVKTPLVELVASLVAQQDAKGDAPGGNFQPYIFWAYAVVCIFLLLFTLWGVASSRRLQKRVGYLEERFREAHPDTPSDS